MKILVDADACPVRNQIEKVAKEKAVPVVFISDTSHMLKSEYAQVKMVEKGNDSADFVLLGMCNKDDIVITNDYGLASLALSKAAKVIHASGMVYTKENIDTLLLERYLNKVQRKISKRHSIKKQRIYKYELECTFSTTLRNTINEILKEQKDENED